VTEPDPESIRFIEAKMRQREREEREHRARDRFIAADGALKFAREMLSRAQQEHNDAARAYQELVKGESNGE
jgi:hypothetical protein